MQAAERNHTDTEARDLTQWTKHCEKQGLGRWEAAIGSAGRRARDDGTSHYERGRLDRRHLQLKKQCRLGRRDHIEHERGVERDGDRIRLVDCPAALQDGGGASFAARYHGAAEVERVEEAGDTHDGGAKEGVDAEAR